MQQKKCSKESVNNLFLPLRRSNLFRFIFSRSLSPLLLFFVIDVCICAVWCCVAFLFGVHRVDSSSCLFLVHSMFRCRASGGKINKNQQQHKTTTRFEIELKKPKTISILDQQQSICIGLEHPRAHQYKTTWHVLIFQKVWNDNSSWPK